MSQNLIENLKMIGLSQHEAQVYLACLELGPSPVWDIAQKSEVKRPTCYVLLDELVRKGFASKTNDQKRTTYSVSSPNEILSSFERRKSDFSECLSQFQALASKSKEKPNIRLFEGEKGIEHVYNMSLDQGEDGDILIYGTSAVLSRYGELIERYINRRVNRGIRARVIMADTAPNREITLKNKEELRQTRFLPVEKFNQQTEVNIFANKIAYIAHSEDNPFATVIENARLAEEEKARFELLWEFASE